VGEKKFGKYCRRGKRIRGRGGGECWRGVGVSGGKEEEVCWLVRLWGETVSLGETGK
jgi:hypothetical protein